MKTSAIILAGWGYWDITHYPYGGCFRRTYQATPCRVLPQGTNREHKVELAGTDTLGQPCTCGKPHVALVDKRAVQTTNEENEHA
jgi:hypothetical protein